MPLHQVLRIVAQREYRELKRLCIFCGGKRAKGSRMCEWHTEIHARKFKPRA